MNLPVPLHATGALYNTKSDLRLLSYIEQHADKGIESRGLDVRGWSAIVLNSSTPLIQEVPLEGHGYIYYFLFRESGPQRFLLTSTDAKLVDILLDRLGIKGRVGKPAVNISKLVAEISNNPAEYSMSAVHTRVEGFGQALRSAAFYGNDVGEAVMFRQLLPKHTPHRVMLRHVARHRDVLSASYWADVGFVYQSESSLRDVDSALRFLSKRGYLDWDVTMAAQAESGEPDGS
jgi:hypothetical protein